MFEEVRVGKIHASLLTPWRMGNSVETNVKVVGVEDLLQFLHYKKLRLSELSAHYRTLLNDKFDVEIKRKEEETRNRVNALNEFIADLEKLSEQVDSKNNKPSADFESPHQTLESLVMENDTKDCLSFVDAVITHSTLKAEVIERIMLNLGIDDRIIDSESRSDYAKDLAEQLDETFLAYRRLFSSFISDNLLADSVSKNFVFQPTQ